MREFKSTIVEEFGQTAYLEFADARNKCLFLMKDLVKNGRDLEEIKGYPKRDVASKIQSAFTALLFVLLILLYFLGDSQQVPLMIVTGVVLICLVVNNETSRVGGLILRESHRKPLVISQREILRELGYYGVTIEYPSPELDKLFDLYLANNDFKYFAPPEDARSILQSIEDSIYTYYTSRATIRSAKKPY